MPASPAHTPPSPLGMEIQINVVTLWANRVESSQIKIFFLGKKWHVIRTETICGSDFCWGWTFQRNKAPSQPCLQPGGVLSVQGLPLSHELHFGSEKCIFHFLKSSPSPELWLFQSAPCRRVWLLIPLFRKRKKKCSQENPIWLKHRMGTKCFCSWEKNKKKRHFLASFVEAAAALGPGEVWEQQDQAPCPLWGGSDTGRDRKHTQGH